MIGRPTIHDVAREAGVSVATVSKAINGRYGVSLATQSKVERVVRELGYESSLVATSMRRGKTHVIGVLVAEFEPFALQLLRGISRALSTTPYDVLAYAGAVSAGEHAGWEHRSLSRLGGTLIDGAIVVTPTTTPTHSPVPLVAIDPQAGAHSHAVIDVANVDGAREATRHLIELGHTRIGHLRGRSDLASAHLREQGYREALRDAGIAFDTELLADGDYRPSGARAGALHLLDLPERPTAVFAANDLSAIELIRLANERGIRVPDDLSVIGFDDIPEASAHQPQLTTVRQPLAEMGELAARTVLQMLDGAPASATRLPAELVVRASTRAPNAKPIHP